MPEKRKAMLNNFTQGILEDMARGQLTISDVFYITTTIQMQVIKEADAQKSPIVVAPGHARVPI